MLALALIVVVSGLFAANKQLSKNPRVLKIGHSLDSKHAIHHALIHFKIDLEALSNKQIKVELYPGGQLGSERDLVELLQIGSLAMAKVSVGVLEAFVPEMEVFSIPYIFRDNDHYWDILNGEVGKELLAASQPVRLKGLGYFDAGSRSFYTCSKAISTPEDLSGLKIRTMKSKSAVALMNELGASATPISFGELYTALQQGVVDGAENNAITFYKSRHYEICKNYTLDQHNSPPDIFMMSHKIWQQLSKQEQKWVEQAMAQSTGFQRKLWKQDTDLAFSALKEAGVNIITPDKAPFKKRVEAYKKTFDGTKIGNLLQRIEAN